MSSEVIIVTKREKVGKSSTRDMRATGMIPATIYGLAEPAVSIGINPKIVARILASDTGMNSLVHLQREGTDIKRHVIIKALQRDPVTGRLAHVDFMRVDPTHKVRVHVPIVLKGIPAGTKEGGILDFVHRQIEVECLPAFIPGHIDVAVDHMVIGDVLRLDQIQLDAHLTVLGDAHNVICSVHGKKAEEEEVAVAAKEPEAAPAKGKK
ncbi:MAG: 50S ribosomal protein L25 [Holophaga sp.]|nr:50S ribosomal protein L25 [Holophaga sp.]